MNGRIFVGLVAGAYSASVLTATVGTVVLVKKMKNKYDVPMFENTQYGMATPLLHPAFFQS